MTMLTLDDVIALLNPHHQRATYGAVTQVVKGGMPQGLMSSRTVSHENSWVVSKTTNRGSGSRRGWPTGYSDDQIHPDCLDQIRSRPDDMIDDAEELQRWIDRRTSPKVGPSGLI